MMGELLKKFIEKYLPLRDNYLTRVATTVSIITTIEISPCRDGRGQCHRMNAYSRSRKNETRLHIVQQHAGDGHSSVPNE